MYVQQPPIAFSGNIPVYYDSYLGPMFFEPFALDMAGRIGKVKPRNVLELASGTGRLTRLLPAASAKDAIIIASDINPAMVEFGKKKVHDNVKWMEIDAVSLPFNEESFDCVVAQFGVMFYSDKQKAFAEAWRVLKPGGVFLFNCWDEIRYNPVANITNEALKQFFPVNTPAFYSVPFSYFDEQVIRKDLGSGGFRDVQIELLKLHGTARCAEDAAEGLINGTPTVTAIRELDAEMLPEIVDYIGSKIAARFGREFIQVPLQAKVVTAVKR